MSRRGLDVLSRAECEDLLRTHEFGRVVTKIGDTMSVLPVYFRMYGDDVVFRTDPGTKLAGAVMRSRVTFEIDDETEGWSVMLVGQAEEVRDEAERKEALVLLAGGWPEGERQRVVRIRPDRITGRRLRAPHALDRSGTTVGE
jgi:nitroimidazol reductase NimA-like FMN-containing flavoprotein (pyridoxamine 5'-phosphate oxidase superfamily)